MSAYGIRPLALLVGLATAVLVVGMPVGNRASAAPASLPAGHPRVLPTVQQARAARTLTATNTLSYGGGPNGVISGKSKVYLVFWGTQWGTMSIDANGNLKFSNDTLGAAGRVQQLFKGLGTGGEQWSGVMTQYCDGVAYGATSCPSGTVPHVKYPTGGGTLAGVWYDNATAAPSAASEPQIGSEAVNRAAPHFGNTTAAMNQTVQYVIVSPKGTNPDNYKTNGFCAWHDVNTDLGVSSPYGLIALTNLPYLSDVGASCGAGFVNAGNSLDGYTIVEGHEYAETLTDWNPGRGWTSFSSGLENADECAWISSGQGAAADVAMGNGSYPMQSTWSNDTNRCDIAHVTVS